MATKLELEAWRDLAVPVLLSKQVVPMPPSTIKFIAALAPADDTAAQLDWAKVNKMFAQYETATVTVTPINHQDDTDDTSLRHIYTELLLIE